ncbi:phytanoyl-CoA dioxygenase family protein [Croceicoccus naphthovorans]|uniref:phytanoyl-CoA dioxygenase family protein n=1 Tax=Croceicoccus naphthovorans TaxID=1348774 RepID=UPI0026BBED72
MTAPSEAYWLDQLQEDGYCIIPQLVAEQQIAALDADLEAAFAQAPLGKGDFYGHRTKRFGSLLRRSQVAGDLVLQPLVLSLAAQFSAAPATGYSSMSPRRSRSIPAR